MRPYHLLKEVFLRAPMLSYEDYDPRRLGEMLASPAFRNALLLSSAHLYEALARKNFEADKLDQRERTAALKYFNRMCFRSTPFGAMASISVLKELSATITLNSKSAAIGVLPDNAELQQGVDQMQEEDLLCLNSGIYRLGKAWRYYRGAADEQGRLQFYVNELETGRFNNALVKWFGARAVSLVAARQWIMAYIGCQQEDAADYLGFLVQEEVLYVSRRVPLIAIEEPVWLPVDSPPEQLAGKRFYSALARPGQTGTPDAALQEQLADAVTILQRLSVDAYNPDLAEFTRRFRLRFDREKVPLPLALDPDAGIGYGGDVGQTVETDLLEGIGFPMAKPVAMEDRFGDLRSLLLKSGYSSVAKEPVNLDIAGLPEVVTGRFQPTAAILFKRTEAGILIEHAGGSSGTNLAGRFSIFSEEMALLCRDLADRESLNNKAVIFADLDHRSHGHTDNINRRLPFYRAVIPLNVFTDGGDNEQIPLNDLYLSIIGDELVLESKSRGLRVIPRLSTAYNYRHSSHLVFRFLGDLQHQGMRTLAAPDPEAILPGLTYYPRLVCSQLVLSPAKWIFSSAELAGLQSVALLRTKHDLPQKILLGQADRQLYFDLDDDAQSALFLACIREESRVVIREYLAPVSPVTLDGKPMDAGFVCFFSQQGRTFDRLPITNPVRRDVRRNFAPGSDWLYLKIYCTPSSANRLLAVVIRPLIKVWQGRLDCWFFIRYTDDKGTHLRLRFRLSPSEHSGLLISLNEQLKRTGIEVMVKELLIDTYRRELERYGPDMIAAVEQFFCAGSLLVTQAVKEDMPALGELRLAIATVNRMLDVFFQTDLSVAASFCAQMSDRFLQEYAMTEKKHRIALDKKYRELSHLIALGIENESIVRESLEPSLRIVKALARNLPDQRILGLQADMIHLQVNRCFSHNQRASELLVYYCLAKYLKSKIARESLTSDSDHS